MKKAIWIVLVLVVAFVVLVALEYVTLNRNGEEKVVEVQPVSVK